MKYKELLYKGWCQKKGSHFLDQMEGWSFKNYEKKEEMFAIPPFPQKKIAGGEQKNSRGANNKNSRGANK